jgi:ParB family chromosome partitioning protein
MAPTALPLGQLQPGRYQPRTRMDETALQELAESIRQHGLMQPIVVRPIAASRWEIIAGERRFRAARLAGLAEVPVVVREVGDEQALALALIENIQREDLNPLEEAQAIRRLIAEFGYTHEQAAEAIGRSRSATSNLLRLLALAEPVQTMLLAGDIEMGHARALLALPAARQTMAASEIHARRLSVREAERLAVRHMAELAAAAPGAPARRARGGTDRDLERLQERLADLLGTRVELRQRARGAGVLSLHFADAEHFEALLGRLELASALEG